MVDFYLTNLSDIGAICPPKPQPRATPSSAAGDNRIPGTGGSGERKGAVPKLSDDVKLSCGHVEADLESSAIGSILTLLEIIRAGNCFID
jgi:hypothetical protein